MKTKILLVRHGETAWTESDQFNGRTNISLSERGYDQARALAKAIAGDDIVICYNSPLQRCQETAKLALENRNIQFETRNELIEMDYGVWEGLARDEIMKQYPIEWQRWNLDPAAIAPPGGETGYQIAARVIPCLMEIVSQWQEKTILIVAHKTVNRIFLAHTLGLPISDYRRKLLQNPCGLNRIEVSENGIMRVALLNDTSHFGKQE
jgi:broad specificity phosphatase PhoE